MTEYRICERLLDWLDNAPLSKPPYDDIREAIALIEELAAALTKAEPLIETLHSITQAKDTRAIVWRALKDARAALAKLSGSGEG